MLGDAAEGEWASQAGGPVKEPDEVAGQVLDAIAEERFLILTDPIAQTWMERKTSDPDRWLHGRLFIQCCACCHCLLQGGHQALERCGFGPLVHQESMPLKKHNLIFVSQTAYFIPERSYVNVLELNLGLRRCTLLSQFSRKIKKTI